MTLSASKQVCVGSHTGTQLSEKPFFSLLSAPNNNNNKKQQKNTQNKSTKKLTTKTACLHLHQNVTVEQSFVTVTQ